MEKGHQGTNTNSTYLGQLMYLNQYYYDIAAPTRKTSNLDEFSLKSLGPSCCLVQGFSGLTASQQNPGHLSYFRTIRISDPHNRGNWANVQKGTCPGLERCTNRAKARNALEKSPTIIFAYTNALAL